MPFFLRTGKRLAEGQRIISIAFRQPPKSMFPVGSGVGAQGPDHLTFDLADASKMSLSFYGKRPGPGMRLDKLSLQFAMHDTGWIGNVLEAYERLILDAMRGDHTLFTTSEGIERLCEVAVPLLEAPPPVRLYQPASWGPKSIHQLVAPHAWRLSTVSKLCKDIDERVNGFLERPLEGEWPYLWLDATYLKVREGGRIVSVAAIIAVAVNTEGKREIVGLGLGPSEAETFWSAFLKGLLRRGLRGVKLVISDAHEGLKHAIGKVLGATWQRCRVHWMRNALAHVPKGQHTMVAAALRQAFLQADQEAARQAWRQLADQLRPRWPKLAGLMDESEHDVLAYMGFPVQHRTKLHSTNPLERLNKEVKRRADVVGIFPGEASIMRLIGAVLLEANDEWQLQHRYMQVEAMAELLAPEP